VACHNIGHALIASGRQNRPKLNDKNTRDKALDEIVTFRLVSRESGTTAGSGREKFLPVTRHLISAGHHATA